MAAWRLPRGLMEVGHSASAAAAAQMLPQFDREAISAETINEIGGVEHALVLAPAADGDEGHLGLDELAQRSAEASLTRVAIARPRSTASRPATSAGHRSRKSSPKRSRHAVPIRHQQRLDQGEMRSPEGGQ